MQNKAETARLSKDGIRTALESGDAAYFEAHSRTKRGTVDRAFAKLRFGGETLLALVVKRLGEVDTKDEAAACYRILRVLLKELRGQGAGGRGVFGEGGDDGARRQRPDARGEAARVGAGAGGGR